MDETSPLHPTAIPVIPATPQASPAVVSTPPTKATLLTTFCEAIRDFEGKPGDLNYALNNPGDCRCSPVGYLPEYGLVTCEETIKGKFAHFPTYAQGWQYLLNLVHQRAVVFPNWTIYQFIADPVYGYSPASDGNPVSAYSNFIALRMGVPVTTTLGDLFSGRVENSP